ncbi:MAG: alpha/beta fold hydrolase, partial [Anaerovoracaceae bacterium]
MPYLLVLIMLVLVGGGLFLGNYAYTKGLSVESKGNARQEISTEEGYGTVFPNEEVYLQTFDDLILHGALVKKNPEDWVIVCHGYRKDGKSMGEQAAKFSEMGFSVLLPDARGHGESQGSYVGMGWHDHWDIVEWITYLNEHFSPRRILLYGLSMGAATVMMVGGEPLPANVQGIIEDCGFSSIKKVFAYQMKKSYKVPAFPLLNFASGICGFRAKYSLRKDGNVLHQLKKCRIPV